MVPTEGERQERYLPDTYNTLPSYVCICYYPHDLHEVYCRPELYPPLLPCNSLQVMYCGPSCPYTRYEKCTQAPVHPSPSRPFNFGRFPVEPVCPSRLAFPPLVLHIQRQGGPFLSLAFLFGFSGAPALRWFCPSRPLEKWARGCALR